MPLTWELLCRLEPRLLALYEEAAAVRDDPVKPDFCANAVWYDDLKPKLSSLVGWERAEHPILGNETAYDVAYEHVYEALPSCRNCFCA
jgi:hypothetical protein